MKRWSWFFLVVGLLVGVVTGLLLDKGVSAQLGPVQGFVMYLTNGFLSSVPTGRAVAFCFTGGGGIHCLPAR